MQKQFPLSVFVLIDSLVVSASQDAGARDYAISLKNDELHLGCHTCLLSYFMLVCLWCGRADGRTVTWLPKILGWVDYHIFLGLGLRSGALRARVEFRYNPLSPDNHIQILCTDLIACENIRFSSLFAAGDVSRGGTSATQRQKFHTDDANQCLHNKSGSHGVPNINLSNFMCLLVDFGILLTDLHSDLHLNLYLSI